MSVENQFIRNVTSVAKTTVAFSANINASHTMYKIKVSFDTFLRSKHAFYLREIKILINIISLRIVVCALEAVL